MVVISRCQRQALPGQSSAAAACGYLARGGEYGNLALAFDKIRDLSLGHTAAYTTCSTGPPEHPRVTIIFVISSDIFFFNENGSTIPNFSDFRLCQYFESRVRPSSSLCREMAPKRRATAMATAAAAAPAQAPPLTGCTIAASGTFPGASQAAIAELIAELGATFVRSVTQDCTHLVATSSELQKQTAKVKAALSNPNVRIVSLSWIQTSADDNAKAPEDDHLVAPNPTNVVPKTTTKVNVNGGSSTGTQQTNGQPKRSASLDTLSKAPAKKQKIEPAPATPAKPKAVPDTTAQDPSQAKSVKIPQDEGVNSLTHQVYVSPDGTIYDASLNQANSSNNNNKFYRIQVRSHSP